MERRAPTPQAGLVACSRWCPADMIFVAAAAVVATTSVVLSIAVAAQAAALFGGKRAHVQSNPAPLPAPDAKEAPVEDGQPEGEEEAHGHPTCTAELLALYQGH